MGDVTHDEKVRVLVLAGWTINPDDPSAIDHAYRRVTQEGDIR